MENEIIKKDILAVISELGKKIFEFEGKNVFITGAYGMLASYMVYVLIYANKNLFKNPCNLYLLVREKNNKFSDEKFIHYIYGDISKSKPKIKESINYIIHTASKAAPKVYMTNMVDTLNTNIKGLYNVLDLVNKKTESILFFSSGEVYGHVENVDQEIKEDYIGRVDHLGKRSCYSEGKRASETICMNYYWERNYPIKIARIFHTFGPGLNLDDGRVFSDFIKMGLDGKNIEIKGNKSFKRPFLYIKDATTMFFFLLLSSKNGEVYNISNNKEIHTVGTVAKLVAEIINKYKKINIKVLENISGDLYLKDAMKSINPSTEKFFEEFNYIPKTSLKEALERTILSCINQSLC
jgi:nucleoside-diphosphate-sugar epimerase